MLLGGQPHANSTVELGRDEDGKIVVEGRASRIEFPWSTMAKSTTKRAADGTFGFNLLRPGDYLIVVRAALGEDPETLLDTASMTLSRRLAVVAGEVTDVGDLGLSERSEEELLEESRSASSQRGKSAWVVVGHTDADGILEFEWKRILPVRIDRRGGQAPARGRLPRRGALDDQARERALVPDGQAPARAGAGRRRSDERVHPALSARVQLPQTSSSIAYPSGSKASTSARTKG